MESNRTELKTENIRTEPEQNPNFLHLWRTWTEPNSYFFEPEPNRTLAMTVLSHLYWPLNRNCCVEDSVRHFCSPSTPVYAGNLCEQFATRDYRPLQQHVMSLLSLPVSAARYIHKRCLCRRAVSVRHVRVLWRNGHCCYGMRIGNHT